LFGTSSAFCISFVACRWHRNSLTAMFFIEEIYVLGNMFIKDDAWFHLNEYIDNQNHRTRSAKNPVALHENPMHLTTVVAGVPCLKKKSGFFKETTTAEYYQNFLLNLLFCWTRNKEKWRFQQDGGNAYVVK
jgi:hypothetical protein